MKDKFKTAFNAGVHYQWSVENSENVELRPNFEEWYENHFPTDPVPVWLIIVKRILGFIPFALLGLIAFIVLFVSYCWSFIRFGGESIAYNQKNSSRKIHDLYIKLGKMQSK